MYQLSFQIRTLAPVVISSNYGEINTVNTEKHIPGTTILGMLAWRYLKQTKSTSDELGVIDENFRHFFLSGAITFTNGWITRKNKYEEDVAFYPAPISFRKSKDNEKEIYDILFAGEDFDEQTQAIEYAMTEYQYTQTALELHHHHARDRITGSPAEGLLFTYEAISPDQVFRGMLLGDKTDLQIILDACEKQWIGWIGRSRNSQYGKVEFSFEAIKPFEMEHLSDEDNNGIVLTMLSHTLIYNNFGFATTSTDDLERYLCGAKVKRKRAALKSRRIENFVGIWGFKKPSEIGFHAGSCFLLDMKDADKKKLSELQITGLGERTHEGFGQIRLESPQKEEGHNHGRVVRNRYGLLCLKDQDYMSEPFYLNNADDLQPEKPSIPLPDHTRTIVQDIVDNTIYNRIRLLAVEELQKFPDEKSPSGSLIKRLEQFLNSRKNNMEKFLADINALKGIATDQMERCRSEEMSLMSFFQKEHETVKIETILNQSEMANIQTICREIDYQPERNIDELTHIYFETFLSLMRKRIKSTQKEK